jgi:hypothetical protein
MTKEKPFTLTVRLTPEEGRLFSALTSLNGDMATEILRKCIRQYIEDHKGDFQAVADKLS